MKKFDGSRGPLNVHSVKLENGSIYYSVVEDGAVVAAVGYGAKYPADGIEEVVKANANLFAASPELLDTLQDARWYVKQAGQLSSEAFKLLDKIDSVIAKALGETNE